MYWPTRRLSPQYLCVCEVWSPRKAKEIPESKGLSHPTRSLAPQKKIDELKAYKCLGYFIERGENSSICKKKEKKKKKRTKNRPELSANTFGFIGFLTLDLFLNGLYWIAKKTADIFNRWFFFGFKMFGIIIYLLKLFSLDKIILYKPSSLIGFLASPTRLNF